GGPPPDHRRGPVLRHVGRGPLPPPGPGGPPTGQPQDHPAGREHPGGPPPRSRGPPGPRPPPPPPDRIPHAATHSTSHRLTVVECMYPPRGPGQAPSNR